MTIPVASVSTPSAKAPGISWGIQASANVLIPLGGHFVTQTVTSPGLFGIESDSDEDYFDQVFAEECASLAAMLSAIGVTVTE